MDPWQTEWRAPQLRKEAYSAMGGVDWIRRPGLSRAHWVPQQAIACLALTLAGALCLSVFTLRHSQNVRLAAHLSQRGNQCTTAMSPCVVLASISSLPASVDLSVDEEIEIKGLSAAGSKSHAVVKSVLAPGLYLLLLKEPGPIQLPATVAIEIVVEKSLGSWIAPAVKRDSDSASTEGK